MSRPKQIKTIPQLQKQNKNKKTKIIKKGFQIELSSHLLFMSKARIIYLYLY